MGKFSVKAKAQEVKSGFESYDGVEPKSGMHRAVIKNIRFKQFKSGSHGFVVLTELLAAKGDPRGHKAYDGWPDFTNVVASPADDEPMKEGSQRGLSNFLAALGVGDDPDIVFEDGDLTKGVKLKKIGTKTITAIEGKAIVTVDIGSETYNDETRMRVRNIFKAKEDGVKFDGTTEDEEAEDETDIDEAEEEAEEDDAEVAEREAELTKLTIVKLRAAAKESGLTAADIKGLSKEELISAILDEEFGVAEDEDEEAEEESVDEDEVEAEDDEEEEEEEEDDEEEDDEEDSARADELAALDRAALRPIAKELGVRVLKTMSDDALREAILAAENSETPF
jgi:hypothetical protein